MAFERVSYRSITKTSGSRDLEGRTPVSLLRVGLAAARCHLEKIDELIGRVCETHTEGANGDSLEPMKHRRLGDSLAAWDAVHGGPNKGEANCKQDVVRIIFEGRAPDQLACDTTLREMPDGSRVMVMLGGGHTEPLPENHAKTDKSESRILLSNT